MMKTIKELIFGKKEVKKVKKSYIKPQAKQYMLKDCIVYIYNMDTGCRQKDIAKVFGVSAPFVSGLLTAARTEGLLRDSGK